MLGTDATRSRVAMGLFGALAGLGLWTLVDMIEPETPGGRGLLALTAFAAATAAGTLALSGPLRLGPALARTALLAAVGAGLLTLASMRFGTPGEMLRALHPLSAWAAMLFLALPFLAAQAGARGGWRDYRLLFSGAWAIVIRFAAAGLFVAVFWAVYFLSHALLGLVGVELLAELADEGWAVFGLSGLVLGISIAALNDAAEGMAPGIVLRLLRLLLPALAAVVAVFLLLIPLRGLDALSAGFSVSGTLLVIAIAAITLISAAADESDAQAARAPLLRRSAQGLALLVPVLAALGAWQIGLRVAQHGLTPPRLAAFTVSGIALVYGLGYAAAVLGGAGWMARIRRINTALALVLIAVCALWLSPALNAERLAAADQLRRLADGRSAPERLDLWTLAHDLGNPGRAALARLRAQAEAPGQEALAARLAQLDAAPDRWSFEYGAQPGEQRAVLLARIAERIEVLPAGAAAGPERALALFADLAESELQDIDRGCETFLADGTRGCVLLFTGTLEGWQGPEALVVYARWQDHAAALFLHPGGSRYRGGVIDLAGRLQSLSADTALGALRAGRYSVGAPRQPALFFEGTEIVPLP
ncbi:MAG: DUF4153 domain-containing protein [Alphaproteobacteria bacterium HGW-Alphaproteobacteria-2]|nr:MAG: DUF4153 domain-containing protein [Alphaproteobacteria bacterium HGW-Alphaproteobacteria-2]